MKYIIVYRNKITTFVSNFINENLVETQLKYEEWFFQSDYDLETAYHMLQSGLQYSNG